MTPRIVSTISAVASIVDDSSQSVKLIHDTFIDLEVKFGILL